MPVMLYFNCTTKVQVQKILGSKLVLQLPKTAKCVNKTIHTLISEEVASSALQDDWRRDQCKLLIIYHRLPGMLASFFVFKH